MIPTLLDHKEQNQEKIHKELNTYIPFHTDTQFYIFPYCFSLNILM